MPDTYEVRIRGPIGPLIQACLPGFTAVTAAESTVLTGTAGGPKNCIVSSMCSPRTD